MNDPPLVTLKGAARVLRAPPHRIIHLCESDVVKPEVGAGGRGTVRRFSPDNLFVAAVALRLQDAGLTVGQLVFVREAFDWLLRVRALRTEIEEGGLVGAIAGLQQGDRPGLLHVVPSEFQRGSPEGDRQSGRGLVAIECGRRLPQPPRSGISFHTNDGNLVAIPVRIVLNLTQLRRDVAHGLTQPR